MERLVSGRPPSRGQILDPGRRITRCLGSAWSSCLRGQLSARRGACRRAGDIRRGTQGSAPGTAAQCRATSRHRDAARCWQGGDRRLRHCGAEILISETDFAAPQPEWDLAAVRGCAQSARCHVPRSRIERRRVPVEYLGGLLRRVEPWSVSDHRAPPAPHHPAWLTWPSPLSPPAVVLAGGEFAADLKVVCWDRFGGWDALGGPGAAADHHLLIAREIAAGLVCGHDAHGRVVGHPIEGTAQFSGCPRRDLVVEQIFVVHWPDRLRPMRRGPCARRPDAAMTSPVVRSASPVAAGLLMRILRSPPWRASGIWPSCYYGGGRSERAAWASSSGGRVSARGTSWRWLSLPVLRPPGGIP